MKKMFFAPQIGIMIAASMAVAFPRIADAASLQGALIRHVTDDRAFYSAGATANVSVVLNPSSTWSGGHVDLAVCSARGVAVQAVQSQTVGSLGAGASQSLVYPVTVPALVAHGYYLAIAALNSGDNGTASCSGTGSTSTSPADVASGAINVAANAWEDINEAFVDAPTLAGTSASTVMANLAQYHISAVQFYDVLWRHDEPYSSSASWSNLEGVSVSKTNLTAYTSAAHGYGMAALAYSLWNGAWSDWATANPNITANMGLYGAPGRKNILTNGGGWLTWGWSTDHLDQLNPYNGRWAGWLANQITLCMENFGFDAAHLDTLGDPGGSQYDAAGRLLPNLGNTLADFTNYVQGRTGAPTDINAVSGWNVTDLYRRGLSPNLYIEPHPEFGNTPGFDDSRALWDTKQQNTSRPLMTAFYPQQVMSGVLATSSAVNGESVTVCDPTNKSGCNANDPGIELMLGQVALDGGSNLTIGDYDHLIPGPYFPRATLGIDGPLQQYLADYYNWWVGMRDILRVGTVSSNETASIHTSDGGSIGQASALPGSVYYHALTRNGIASEVAMTNMVGLNYNRIDDPDGKNSPTTMNNLSVTTEIFGTNNPGTLWFSAPDINHGFPQKLTYTESSGLDGNGRSTISYTVPKLKTVGVAWLESDSLTTGDDFTVGGAEYIRGGTANWYSNGVGQFNTYAPGLCCGKEMRWDGIDFGSGATSVTLDTGMDAGGTVEFRLDTNEGPLMATFSAPSSVSTLTQTANLPTPVSGIHSVFVKFPGRPVTLIGWKL